jgi:hypothetical protein
MEGGPGMGGWIGGEPGIGGGPSRRRTRNRRRTIRDGRMDRRRTIRNRRIIGDKRIRNRCGIFVFFTFLIIFICNYFLIFFFFCKEINIPEGFEVENGILGLIRGVYLSLVRFLDSSILRKV